MNLKPKKIYIIRSVFTVLFISIPIIINASNIYQTNADINVRIGPSSKYKSIGVIKKGEKVSVIDETNSKWFKIDYNGQNAFLPSKFLTVAVVEKSNELESHVDPKPKETNSAVLYIIVFLIVILVIWYASKRKKAIQQQSILNNSLPKTKNELKEEQEQIILKIDKVTVTNSNSLSGSNDESIIDITDQAYIINSNNNLKNYYKGVPYWAHQYVYAYSEINEASNEQKNFYSIFKENFLNGEYFELEGNTNYSFILLFDLLNEYDYHKDISKLENHLKILGQCYPKTKSYGISFLIERMETEGKSDDVSRLREEDRYSHQNYHTNYDYDYWRLGSKYKSKLNLNEEEEKLLNKLWYPSNNFCSIEFCFIEVLKIFLLLISELKAKYTSEGTTIDKEFTSIADIIARKHFRYRSGSQNYEYSIDSLTNEFYLNIFKHCENAVREFYGHKRKLNTEINYSIKEVKIEFDSKIISKVSDILPRLISYVTPPDESTEIELYSQTTSRWKIKFEELTINHKDNPSKFVESIIELGNLNKKNPSIENIYLEASKFISKIDKESALLLYIHYLYQDLKSVNFDNKQLTKTIQKTLFENNEQLHKFEKIVSELIKEKNLDKALKAVPKIYEVKRKKIQLDKSTIKKVQHQHTGTVELLNEYLRDDFEDDNNTIQFREINSGDIEIEINQKNEEYNYSPFLNELLLNPIQKSILELFSKNNFSIHQSVIEEIARSKGFLNNQLIESINEACYEVIDDVLIEEEDNYYSIIPEYFKKISRNDK